MCLKNTNLPCAYQINPDSFFFCAPSDVFNTEINRMLKENIIRPSRIEAPIIHQC